MSCSVADKAHGYVAADLETACSEGTCKLAARTDRNSVCTALHGFAAPGF